MTTPASPAPQRSHARSNRARILEVARGELGARPDATLDEIAQAAGVARRTLYGHFPGRDALLEALAEDASEAMRQALAGCDHPEDRPEQALARFVSRMWQVADRYRMLLSLARRDLGEERVGELLAPATAHSVAVLERGQAEGVFHRHLPAPVLSAVLRGIMFALRESVDLGRWDDDGTAAVIAHLIAAGVAPDRAPGIVDDIG